MPCPGGLCSLLSASLLQPLSFQTGQFSLHALCHLNCHLWASFVPQCLSWGLRTRNADSSKQAVHLRSCAKAGQCVQVMVQENTSWDLRVIPPVVLHTTLWNGTPENPGSSLCRFLSRWTSTRASSGSRQTRPRPIHLLIQQPRAYTLCQIVH